MTTEMSEDIVRRVREYVGGWFMTGNELRGIVREVREYIEKHGWCQRKSFSQDGAVCIWGAYDRITHRDRVNVMPFHDVVTAGLPESDDGRDKIIAFNDDPKTTIEDVLLHLKRVEARLEAGS